MLKRSHELNLAAKPVTVKCTDETSYEYKKRGILPKFLFRNDFHQPIGFTPGDTSSRRDCDDANRGFVVAPTDYDFVTGFYGVR